MYVLNNHNNYEMIDNGEMIAMIRLGMYIAVQM